MDSREQNKRLEVRAGLALVGARFNWEDTEISETPQAIATDPVRLSREGWWKNVEPRDNRGREIIGAGILELLRRDVRSQGRDARDEDPLAELLPGPGDNSWKWADELATKVDTNGDANPWYQALRVYVHKFPQTALGSDL